MPPTDRKGTLFGGDAVHVALILQTRATARRARNALSRLLRRYHAAEPASARDRGTIVRKHISGLHRRGVSTAVHSAWPVKCSHWSIRASTAVLSLTDLANSTCWCPRRNDGVMRRIFGR